MIIFDATYLVVLLNPNSAPAKDRQNKPVSMFKERVEYLTAELNASGEQIGIPTPAMAEVLVRAGNGRSKFVSTLSDRWRFQILPFDSRAAIEASELIALIKSKSDTWATHAKVKFDIQIVSIARVEAASVIYADDEDIERFAKRLKIPVVRICDLPTPPPKQFPVIEAGPIGGQQVLFGEFGERQAALNLDLEPSTSQENSKDESKPQPSQDAARPSPEASDKREADPAHPAAVRGSDEGRT